MFIPVLFAGTAIALASYVILSFVFSEERRVNRRLQALGDYESQQALEVEPLLQPFRQRVAGPIAAWLAGGVRAFAPGDSKARTRSRLVKAGNPGGLDADGFAALKVLAAAGTAVVCLLLLLIRGTSLGWILLICSGAAAAGFFIPDMWLNHRTQSRKVEIRRAMPDMLDMLTISVESGLGFDAAVAKLVTNSEGPLAHEFARMLQDVQAGMAREDAFRGLAERTDVPEINTFVMSMIQADVFGISVSSVLRTQAREMRVKRRQYAEEQAQKAPVKIVFPLILCILPATLIVVVGPAIVSIIAAFSAT